MSAQCKVGGSDSLIFILFFSSFVLSSSIFLCLLRYLSVYFDDSFSFFVFIFYEFSLLSDLFILICFGLSAVAERIKKKKKKRLGKGPSKKNDGHKFHIPFQFSLKFRQRYCIFQRPGTACSRS